MQSLFLVMWYFKLIVRWSSNLFRACFLGSTMKMDLLWASGISPLSYIWFIIPVILSMPKSSNLFSISVVIKSGPVLLILFISANDHLNLKLNISGLMSRITLNLKLNISGLSSFSFLCIACFSHSCREIFLQHIYSIFSLFPFSTVCNLLTNTSFVLLFFLFFFCILALFMILMLSVYSHFSLSHLSLAYMDFWLIFEYNGQYSISFLDIASCLFFVISCLSCNSFLLFIVSFLGRSSLWMLLKLLLMYSNLNF